MDKTIKWQQTKLENDSVCLIPIQPTDFETLFQVASDPLIWEQHPSNDRYKREVFREFFNEALDSTTAFLIIDKITDEIIGSTRYYDYQPENSSVAIGYTFLARKFWGGATNRSCKALLINNAFEHANSVHFHVAPKNFRSQQAVLKLGATKHREFILTQPRGSALHFEYVLKKEDWKGELGQLTSV